MKVIQKYSTAFLEWYAHKIQEQKKGFYDFIQKIYITVKVFKANDFKTLTSAGAYNFLLSAIPIGILVLTIFLKVLNTSPEAIINFLKTNNLISANLDVQKIMKSILRDHTIGLFEISIGLFIVWQARCFFASIQHSIRKVYRKKIKKTPLKTSLIVIIGEILVVLFIVFAVITFFAGAMFLKTSTLQKIFTSTFVSLTKYIVRYVWFIFILLFVFFVYYFMPPIKPTKKNAFLSALCCSLAYLILQIFFFAVQSIVKFNAVYGLFSNIIFLLCQVWFFFFLFIFFSQFMYVSQFLDSFIISQLYRLPKKNDAHTGSQFVRALFIVPPQKYLNHAKFIKAGKDIFRLGEKTTECYYIIEGNVRITSSVGVVTLKKGDFFGEVSCLVDGRRKTTATALTETLLLVIRGKTFSDTVSIDAAVSRHALKKISRYL